MKVGKEVGAKLSVQSFGWNKPSIQEKVFADKENDLFLGRFGGVATGLRGYKNKNKENADDPDTLYGLTGQFKGYHPDGQTTVSGTILYLPTYIHDMVAAALSMDDGVVGIRIGFDIYARYNERSATSYSFVANDLLNEGNPTVDGVAEVIEALALPGASEAPLLEHADAKKNTK